MPAMVILFVLCLDFAFAFMVWALPPLEIKSFSDGLREHPLVGVCFFMCSVATMSLALEVGASRLAKLLTIWFSLVGVVGIMLFDNGDQLHAYVAVVAMVGPSSLAAVLWTEGGSFVPLMCAALSIVGAGVCYLLFPVVFWLFELFLFLSLGWAFWSYLNR